LNGLNIEATNSVNNFVICPDFVSLEVTLDSFIKNVLDAQTKVLFVSFFGSI